MAVAPTIVGLKGIIDFSNSQAVSEVLFYFIILFIMLAFLFVGRVRTGPGLSFGYSFLISAVIIFLTKSIAGDNNIIFHIVLLSIQVLLYFAFIIFAFAPDNDLFPKSTGTILTIMLGIFIILSFLLSFGFLNLPFSVV
jgi:hypothetical protein